MSRPDWIYGPDGILAKPDAWAVKLTAAERAAMTGWPEGVLARYLSVGGATVDITNEEPGNEEPYAEANCLGCSWRSVTCWDDLSGFLSLSAAARSALEAAGAAAQDHASTCRAMPKPGGAQ